jgi:hypothetical protein
MAQQLLADSVQIAEHEVEPSRHDPDAHAVAFNERYPEATEIELRDYTAEYSFPTFITAVCRETNIEGDSDSARLVSELENPDDTDFGLLLAFPDETLMFVGSDPTAKDSIPWFAYTIERAEPMPAPDTAQDALDRLKTPSVRDVEHEDNFLPPRHGEWWLLPCSLVPGGTVFSPGVSSKPYGASPLGNHVPREYAFAVSDDEFMSRAQAEVDLPSSIETPPELIEWANRQIKKPHEDVLSWADVRAWAGEVLVRGTLRHRDNDHFVENLDETWHTAGTHDIKVYTGDDMASRVHIDYHGR